MPYPNRPARRHPFGFNVEAPPRVTPPTVSRRALLRAAAATFCALQLPHGRTETTATLRTGTPATAADTRGILILDTDIVALPQWPRMAHRAGLNTIAIGPGDTDGYLRNFLEREAGARFLDECRSLGLHVEHETHLMQYLLPRALFDKAPDMFAANRKGERVRDHNCCASSREGLDVIAANAVLFARRLVSTTGRHFFWIDDALPMCRCTKCRGYSDSDQSLILSNRIAGALRAVMPDAQVAHLAYTRTLAAPTQVRPAPGVFLEFAPINRLYDQPLSNRQVGEAGKLTHGAVLDALDANLEIFPRETAKVLEYWLDASRFCSWKRPATKLPWRPGVVRDDIRTYRGRGIRHISSYCAWIDADYIARFGEPPLPEFAAALAADGTAADVEAVQS